MVSTLETWGSVSLNDGTVVIQNIEINKKELVNYLDAFPEDDRTTKIIHLIEVGLACMERVHFIQDKDYVEKQIKGAVDSVERAIGHMPELVKDRVLENLGTKEGQALHVLDT